MLNVWYGSYLGLCRLLYHKGKTYNLQKEKPCSWGRKNPMSHLSRIKNPDLPMSVRSSGPAGLRTTSCLLGCFSLLGNHCFLDRDMQSLLDWLPCFIACLFPISWPSPVCYLLLTIAIYAMPPSPLRPIEGVKGIHPLTTVIPKRAGYVCLYSGYLLCLGPSH